MANIMDFEIAGFTAIANSYTEEMDRFERYKIRLGEIVLSAIVTNGCHLNREDDPVLFEIIDKYQLDDAYILNAATNLSATLHSHRHRNGTKYTSMSYEMTID